MSFEVRQRPVPGNDLYVPRNLCDDRFDLVDHTADAATGLDIDERETIRDKITAHVQPRRCVFAWFGLRSKTRDSKQIWRRTPR
jgi:hypothetical protein